MTLEAVFTVFTLKLQERIDELCRAGGLVNAPHVGIAIATAGFQDQ